MNAAAQIPAAKNTVTDARARFAAKRAAVVAPYAASIAALVAAGAVVEVYASPACADATHWTQRCDFARVQVWIFDQKGRVHVSAKLEAYNGAPLCGNAMIESAGPFHAVWSELSELIAVARAARTTRVN